MKIYIKILGILSLVTILAVIIFLSIISLESKENDRLLSISLFIPTYFILHFLIINRFGFNFKQEEDGKFNKLFITISIFSILFLFLLPVNFAFNHFKEENFKRKLELEFDEMKDWGEDITAYGYIGQLKTKYHKGEIIIKDYSHAVDEEGVIFGISANSNSYLSIKDYARIGKWDLLVTTK